MIWDILGWVIGASVYGLLVYNLIFLLMNFITGYKFERPKILISSLVISIVFSLFYAELMNNWFNMITIQTPSLILVFLFLYRRETIQKCPHCAEKIKADAFKCKHCHSQVSS